MDRNNSDFNKDNKENTTKLVDSLKRIFPKNELNDYDEDPEELEDLEEENNSNNRLNEFLKTEKQERLKFSDYENYKYFIEYFFSEEGIKDYRDASMDLPEDKSVHHDFLNKFFTYGLIDSVQHKLFIEEIFFKLMAKETTYLYLSIFDFAKKDIGVNGRVIINRIRRYSKNDIKKVLKPLNDSKLLIIYNASKNFTDKTKMVIFFPLLRYGNLFKFVDSLDKKDSKYLEFLKSCENKTLTTFMEKYSLVMVEDI